MSRLRNARLSQPCWQPDTGERVYCEGFGFGTAGKSSRKPWITWVQWDTWAHPCSHPSYILRPVPLTAETERVRGGVWRH